MCIGEAPLNEFECFGGWLPFLFDWFKAPRFVVYSVVTDRKSVV